MAGENMQTELQPWTFEPVDIELLPDETAPYARISPIVRTLGTAATYMGLHRREFKPTDEHNYFEHSVILQTPEGPVHYYRLTNDYHNSGRIAVEYPATIGPLPDHMIATTLKAERAELHKDTTYGQGEKTRTEREQRGSWRVDTDDPKRHYWLTETDKSELPFHFGSGSEHEVVLDGKLGTLHVPDIRTIKLANIGEWDLDDGYIEELPQISGVQAVLALENRFKQLAIDVADYLGGAKQLSSQMHEKDPWGFSFRYSSFREGGSVAGRATQVARRLSVRGFATRIYQRTPGENVQPGFKVVIGNRLAPEGKETIIAYDGLSTFWYTRGDRSWKMHRGIVLRNAATLDDIDSVMRPLKKDKLPNFRLNLERQPAE